MNKKETQEMVDLAFGPFTTQKPDVNTYRAWFLALEKISKAEVEKAIAVLIAEDGRTFAPTPGEVCEVINAPKRAQAKLQREQTMMAELTKAHDPREAKRIVDQFWSDHPDIKQTIFG